MKKNLFYITSFLIWTSIMVSCAQDKQVIRELNEVSTVYNGKAVITQIRDVAGTSGADDKNYVEIYYDFVPVKKGVPAYSEIESTGRMLKLFYDNREIFHKNWVKKWGIKSGNEYPALRRVTRKDNKINYVTYEVYLEPEKK